ncbi:MAG: hypothetical protein WCR51_01450 [Planctomycetia bacterium]
MATAHLQTLPPRTVPGVADRIRSAFASARSVPSSLPPFWIACALTLIVAHYQLWGRLNIVYKILGTVVVVMMPFTAGFARIISRPAVIWLLVFEAVMVANMALGRYFTVSSLFTTASAPVILIRSLPFLLCGYTLARHPLWQRRFLLFVGAVYWLFAVQDARGFIAGARAQLGRAETYTQTQGLDDTRVGSMYVGAFTYFAPLMLFFAIGLFRLYPTLSKPWKMFVIVIQVTFSTVAVLAGFGATTTMAFLAVLLLAIYAPVKTIGWRLYYLGISGAAFAIFEVIRRALLDQGGRGAAGDAFAKFTLLFQSLWSALTGVDMSALERASSSRIPLMLASLETFLRNPIVGHGFYGASDLDIGGHSFLVDTAAIFGLVGLVPILFFFSLVLTGLRRKNRHGGRTWPISSSRIFVLLLLAGLVMNPYFLSLLSLSYFLFLLLGFALADSEVDTPSSTESVRPARQAQPLSL